MRCTIHRWCNSCDSVRGSSDKNPAKVNTLNSVTCNFCHLRWNSPTCLIVTITRYFPWRDFIHPFQTSKSNLKEMGQKCPKSPCICGVIPTVIYNKGFYGYWCFTCASLSLRSTERLKDLHVHHICTIYVTEKHIWGV